MKHVGAYKAWLACSRAEWLERVIDAYEAGYLRGGDDVGAMYRYWDERVRVAS